MDSKDEKILLLLEAIDKKQCQSQRELSKKLNISLGLVNTFIKDLAIRGIFEIINLPKNKVQYILTPKGNIEKANLTRQYFTYSIRYYTEIKSRIAEVLNTIQDKDNSKLIFYGAGEICEIACVIVGEKNFDDVKIIDSNKAGRKICGRPIHDESKLEKYDFDAVVIMDQENFFVNYNKLKEIGVSSERIFIIPQSDCFFFHE